jgi:hypothetical protein
MTRQGPLRVQTEKNSVRAYVFGFTLSTGHCSAQSTLRIWAMIETRAPQQTAPLANRLVGLTKVRPSLIDIASAYCRGRLWVQRGVTRPLTCLGTVVVSRIC